MSKNNKDTLDQSYLIYVRSKDCEQLTTGFNTDMKITFDYAIKRSNANQDFHLSLSTAHIPFNFYQFSSNLNNLIINVDGSSSFVLDEGNYDIFNLVDLITASSFPYNASYNENNNKITLTNSDATIHTINFTSSNLYKNLGFTNEDIVISSGGSITSTGAINLQTIHTLYLHSDLTLTNVLTSETKNISNIIDSINVDVNSFDIISHGYYESAPFSSILDQQEIRDIGFSLRDQNGNLVQMNSTNFEFSLLIELHDKENNENIIPVRNRRSEITDIQNIPIPIQQPKQIDLQPAPKQPQMSLIKPKPVFINTTNTNTNINQNQNQNTNINQNQNTNANTNENQNPNANINENTNTNTQLNDALLMASILTL